MTQEEKNLAIIRAVKARPKMHGWTTDNIYQAGVEAGIRLGNPQLHTCPICHYDYDARLQDDCQRCAKKSIPKL